jgi:hypothetical protein
MKTLIEEPMSNTLTGKITNILPIQSGTSKSGNEWKKQDFVIETDGQYPKQVCFTKWGGEIDYKIGQIVTVSFDLESREYQGKYFTDAKAWKIEADEAQGVTTAQVKEVLGGVPESDSDDLPFAASFY